jgi:hypothetical protein
MSTVIVPWLVCINICSDSEHMHSHRLVRVRFTFNLILVCVLKVIEYFTIQSDPLLHFLFEIYAIVWEIGIIYREQARK